jgi:hypothetical protein
MHLQNPRRHIRSRQRRVLVPTILPWPHHPAGVLKLTQRHAEGSVLILDTGLIKPTLDFPFRPELLILLLDQHRNVSR